MPWAAGVAVLVIALTSTAVAEPRITIRDSTHKYKYKPSTLYFASPALMPPFKLTKLQRWVSWSIRQSEGDLGITHQGFTSGGFLHAKTVYANVPESGQGNETNSHAVSQYDVACFQQFSH